MSTETFNIVRDSVNSASAVLFGFIVVLAVIGLIKPGLYRRLLSDFSQRKYIFMGGLFACLLSGTVFVATQSTDTTLDSRDRQQTIQPAGFIDDETSGQPQAGETRVEQEEVVQSVPFDEQVRQDDSLRPGETRRLQAGVNGRKKLIYAVTYSGDREMARMLEGEVILSPPKPEIIAVDSKAFKLRGLSARPPASNRSEPGRLPQSLSSPLPKVPGDCKHKDSRPAVCLH